MQINNSFTYLHKLLFRFRQFGGLRLVKAYFRLGIVWFVVCQIVKCTWQRKPYKAIYPAIGRKVCAYLTNRYTKQAKTLVEGYRRDSGTHQEHRDRNVIWFCWMQGIESAPELVKACFASLQRNLLGYEINVITSQNYSDYVSIPQDLILKYESGIMPHPMFTDLIRLELLIRYGGTWIDSTVLCTNGGLDKIHEIMHCPLFMFQYRNRQTGALLGISNWFISSDQNNTMLCALRDLLYQYWRDHDCVVYYFMFHHFFMMLVPYFPGCINEMPKVTSNNLLILETKMSKNWSPEWYCQFTTKIPFHKLNYRVGQSAIDNPNSIYHHIIKEYNT